MQRLFEKQEFSGRVWLQAYKNLDPCFSIVGTIGFLCNVGTSGYCKELKPLLAHYRQTTAIFYQGKSVKADPQLLGLFLK